MTSRLAIPELVALDPDRLEASARSLSRGDCAGGEHATERLVSFRLRGRPCAVDARVVERAVSRLSRPLAVPLQDGSERLVAFVEELPVPVADLQGFVVGAPREPTALEAHPALLVTTPLGPIAVAVEGPLELLEDHLAFAAQGGDPATVQALGMLSGGSLALDPTWLQEWAEKTARP